MSNLNDGQNGLEKDKKDKEKSPTMPQVSFSTFVLSLYSSALVQLGEVPDPNTGEMSADLEVARHTIDILTMLFDKTVNNIDEDDKRLISGLLYELRMKYIVKNKS